MVSIAMRKDEARQLVCDEFRSWCRARGLTNPIGTDGFVFFGDLSKTKPRLLRFRTSGDKWQTVHGWLRREGLVSEPHES